MKKNYVWVFYTVCTEMACELDKLSNLDILKIPTSEEEMLIKKLMGKNYSHLNVFENL